MKKTIVTLFLFIILIFPKNTYANGSTVKYLNTNNSISQVSTLQAEKNSTRNFTFTKTKANILNISSFLVLGAMLFIQYKKYKSVDSINLKDKTIGTFIHLNSAQAGTLVKGNYQPERFIISTVLDWQRRGIVSSSLENYLNSKGEDRSNYIFKKTGNSSSLSNDETYLYDFLFSMGDGTGFSTNQLNQTRRESSNDYNSSFNKYLKLVQEELIEMGLLYRKPPAFIFSSVSILVSLMGFISSLISILLTPISIINAVLGVALLVLAIATLSKRPKLGKEQFDLYNNLYESIVTDSVDASNYSEEDREILVIYAVAFSLSYDDIKNLNAKLNLSEDDFIPIFWLSSASENLINAFNRALIGNSVGSRVNIKVNTQNK